MNLRSFEKVNLRTASIRSKESSESLILFIGTRQPLILPKGFPVSAYNRVSNVQLTQRRGPDDPSNANIPNDDAHQSSLGGLVVGPKRTRFGMGSSKDAGRDNLLQGHECSTQHRGLS